LKSTKGKCKQDYHERKKERGFGAVRRWAENQLELCESAWKGNKKKGEKSIKGCARVQQIELLKENP